MPSRHIAANAANFAYRAKQNRVSTFSDGCVSNAAFLCGKIGYKRFLVRGCYCKAKTFSDGCVSNAAFLCGKIGYRRFLVRGCYCKAKTFSDGCVSNAAFLCGKIGYRRFLVRGCYNIKSSRCQPTQRYAVFCLSAKVFYIKMFSDKRCAARRAFARKNPPKSDFMSEVIIAYSDKKSCRCF